MKPVLVSRDKLCKYTLSAEPEDWKKCNLPGSHKFDSTYTMVYIESHLDIQKYDCGCVIYTNKYYPEFKYPESIWRDFFTETIEVGQKLIKFYMTKSNKK